MTASLVFFALLAGIAAWWLAQQRLGAKPWLETNTRAEPPAGPGDSLPVAKIGLGVFLAVVGSLFALLVSAYSMRLDEVALLSAPAPNLLWATTGLLVLSSIALQLAQYGARHGSMADLRNGLLAADVSMLAFLAGQVLAWGELVTTGQFVATSPAIAFFYLLTALHALHVLGGLIALARTTVKAWRAAEAGTVRLSVELCALYSHFLLAVWLVLFGLLMGWTNDFVELCRQLVP